MKTLEDTIPYMTSDDYKARMIAEYYQIDIRCKKLKKMLVDREANLLGFDLTTPVYILEMQLEAMEKYRNLLLTRMQIEGIAY